MENGRADANAKSSARDVRKEEAHALVGHVISDRYRVEHVVGIGGVGTVYRATQLGLERRVAVKVLRPELLRNKTAMARFTREARVAANLQHPNIVTVHDFGMMPDGRAYLVMEYLEGLNLAQWIRAERPTDLRRAVGYLRATCDGVATLHRNGIIHRDIKPSNIVIAKQRGGGSIVKIVDFGFVRPELSDEAGDLTGGLVVGTPEFMAPELFTGRKPNVLSDVYALGVSIYETLTGDLPFGVGSFKDMFQRHARETLVPPTERRRDLPRAADALVARAMHREPEERYRNVEELAASLDRLLVEEPRPRQREATVEIPTDEIPFDDATTKVASILVVEDDAAVRDQLVADLEGHAFAVTTASDGIEAFLLLGNRKFDLILSDLAMPHVDGMTLLRLKSEKGIKTPVVFITGHSTDRTEGIAYQLGAAGFVRKPISPEDLVEKIKAVLEIS